MTEYLYGRNPIYESLKAGRRQPERLFIEKGVQVKGIVQDILNFAKKIKIPFEFISSFELGKMTKTKNNQGIVLQSSSYPYVEITEILDCVKNKEVFLLLLDLLNDPQNVGSLLRTAEIVGVDGVVLQERRSVGITPSVVNSSSGAVEHLAICQVSNLNNIIQKLKKENIWVYGLEGGDNISLYSETNLKGSLAVVVGSEGQGLRSLVKKNCDGLISLPMKGNINSLNATVAGSIVLYEAWRQRGFR